MEYFYFSSRKNKIIKNKKSQDIIKPSIYNYMRLSYDIAIQIHKQIGFQLSQLPTMGVSKIEKTNKLIQTNEN